MPAPTPTSPATVQDMLTIGQVAKRFALSRSTLLYYDEIGLLRPSGRSRTNYRLYSEADLRRMERICRYRSAGLSLEAIAGLLDNAEEDLATVLHDQLAALNREIQQLRDQQRLITQLLQAGDTLALSRVVTKEIWTGLLRAAGLDERGMHRWHAEFERTSPEAHRDFLESLGLEEKEIGTIRAWSRGEWRDGEG
ncbi:putative transcriptional regulator [Thioflavicoccus mobilis 8321]|uniref:Putative transcriptional regulator n=2 Tax=Thioflavicoccus mobilis TaxID=80679 RepID=L0GU29_9GAMM|nr:putative transcriptional regulator [Thioflavicoccus mobilis 8321]